MFNYFKKRKQEKELDQLIDEREVFGESYKKNVKEADQKATEILARPSLSTKDDIEKIYELRRLYVFSGVREKGIRELTKKLVNTLENQNLSDLKAYEAMFLME
jgi:vacuolar-type H+-ATPase subunit H